MTLVDDAPPCNRLTPEPGELLDHVYRIQRLQGRGGCGTVMLAHDELLDRPVALKFLHPTLTELETQRRRFLNEARAMARMAVRRQEPLPALDAEDDEFWAEVRALPKRQAQAIALHYLEDRPVAEVADILDCSPSTAKVHLHKGRVRLAERLRAPLGDSS